MAEFIKLPVGIENFEKIRRDGFYYVDKTRWIEQLLAQWGKVNLFTRPRRFGKSYAANMLAAYYSKGADSEEMFFDLEIGKQKILRSILINMM